MNKNFPNIAKKLGLGLGMDIHWGAKNGFIRDEQQGDRISATLQAFLHRYGPQFAYFFVAFQPRNRSVLKAADYFPLYDELYRCLPTITCRVMHHTLLNMGAWESYNRKELYKFTNSLIERYDYQWIVEDLGLWSVGGKTVPFPLPPFMTPGGLQACIRNITEIKRHLAAPLAVEFPGFTEGTNFFIGKANGYTYFRRLVEETGVAVTLDIGHILSYQWLIGKRFDTMLEGLDELPFAHCLEIHLSGCTISNGKFRDLHHGILLDEQLELLRYVLPRCPNLKGITYEDPQFTAEANLVPKSIKNFERLQAIVHAWKTDSHPAYALGAPLHTV